jgi:hypothetical protein
MMWILKACTLIIDVSQLTNAMKLLPILVCLLILTRIDQILATYHFIYINDWVECENIKILMGLLKYGCQNIFFKLNVIIIKRFLNIATMDTRYINLLTILLKKVFNIEIIMKKSIFPNSTEEWVKSYKCDSDFVS